MIADLMYILLLPMEHLGDNLINARHGLTKVRLFADLRLELKGSFHTLHRHPGLHLGWFVDDHGQCQPSESISRIDPEASDQSNRSMTKFVQRWLWFEVLREILGHLPGFDLGDFVRVDPENNHLITTEKLPEYLERWQNIERQDPNWGRQVQAHLILQQARLFVSQYCAVSGDKENPIWPIDPRVALSIMVLGETLTTALIRLQQSTEFEAQGWQTSPQGWQMSPEGWGYSSEVIRLLKLADVCPNKIYMLQGLFQNNTIGLLYALQLLPTNAPGEIHQDCDARRCSPIRGYFPSAAANQSDTPRVREGPEPIHYGNCKSCRQVGPDTRELSRIIQEGKIPLLQYNKDSGTVNLVEMSESIDKHYVVFSHVWADGYGNPNANTLNQCVLNNFMELFTKIRHSKNHPPAIAPERFWIDTLAIPVQDIYKAQRKKAIRNMHRIYKGAKCTIVLDAGLMKMSRGEGYAQPAMSISVSKWMTRLWTLHEAVLSKELYFNFSDEIISMDHLEAQFPKASEPLHSTVAFASHIYYHGIMKNESRAIHGLGSDPEDRRIKPGLVAAAWKALQWRTTAHCQHETLALATMLNVDTNDFADSDNTITIADESQIDRRMQKLLDLLAARKPCLIPPGMIFLAGPRLTKAGYRWAPRTWLSSCPVEPPDALTLKCPKARLNIPHGLEVRFPGFLLYRPQETPGLFTDDNEFYFPTSISLSQWYCILRADEEAENKDPRDLAIIAPRLPAINPREIALLVAVSRKDDHIYYVQILHRVWINEVSDPEKMKSLRHNFLAAGSQSMSCGEKLSDKHYWCVDGVDPTPPINQHEDDHDRVSKTPTGSWSWLPRRIKAWR